MSSAELDAILASIFMTPDGKADPYPGLATVREAAQIHHSALGLKVATRYDDVSVAASGRVTSRLAAAEWGQWRTVTA